MLEDWKVGRLEGWGIGRLGGWEVGGLEDWKHGALCVGFENYALIYFDDDVLLFYGDWEGVCDVGAFFALGVGCFDVLAALDLDFVFSDAALGGAPPRLSGFDVEFPTVPGASEDLAFAGVVVGTGGR